LLEDGSIIGWGDDYYRQITGIPDFRGRRIIQISMGLGHSLALLDDGAIIGWGNDEYEETIPPAFGGRRVRQISAGGSHSLAILEDGTVIGWGANEYDQSTIPNFLPLPPPFQPLPDFKIQEEPTLVDYQALKQKVECPQCHLNLKKVILDCDHAFCETCSNRLINCPTCAKEIISKTVFHQKYLTY